MKKLLTIILLFLVLSAQAQTFFLFDYKDNHNIPYRSFLIFNGDQEVSQIRTYNKLRPQTVYWRSYNTQFVKDGNDQSTIAYTVMSIIDDNSFPDLIFDWNGEGTYIQRRTPYLRFNHDDSSDKWIRADYMRELSLLDLDETFLQSFYSTDDPLYTQMLNAHKTAIEQEKALIQNLPDGSGLYYYMARSISQFTTFTDYDSPEALMQKLYYPSYYKAYGEKLAGDLNNYSEEIITQENNGGQHISNPEKNNHRNPLLDDNEELASKQTLHLFVVGNTSIGDIGSSVKVDVQRITAEMRGVANRIGMNYAEYKLTGRNLNKSNLIQKLSELQPSNDDVVIFLYSGHGFRFDDQKDVYPMFALVTDDYTDIRDGNYVALSDVNSAIIQKGARLNIVMSDCCNSFYGTPSPLPLGTNTLSSRSNVNLSTERLKDLFYNHKGNIICTASSPGEVSWCTQSGGNFTCSFLDAFRKAISLLSNEKISWEQIFYNTIENAKKFSISNGTKTQNGIKEVKVKLTK